MNGQGQMQPSEFLKFRPSRSHAQFPTCHKYPAARKLLQMAAAQRRTHPLLKYNSEVGLFEEEPKIDPLGGVGRREGRPEGMNERIGLLGIYGMEFALCIPCPCPPTDNDLSLSFSASSIPHCSEAFKLILCRLYHCDCERNTFPPRRFSDPLELQ